MEEMWNEISSLCNFVNKLKNVVNLKFVFILTYEMVLYIV